MSVSDIDLVAYSGVFTESSVKGLRWVVDSTPENLVRKISAEHNTPEIISRIIASRDISSEQVADFLRPSLRSFLPDPFHLKDMESACLRIISAVEKNEKILVFGDYDVDGATASAIFIRYLRMLGVEAGYYIPDRMGEGYGLNRDALKKIKDAGTKLIITVDCGTNSGAIIDEIGVDMVVIDHHIQHEPFAKKGWLVNPNRIDENSSLSHVCSAGLAFLTIVGVNNLLKKQDKSVTHEDMLSLLDLVALGTVCDVMPLRDLNRAYVAQGLKVMKYRNNKGLAAIMEAANLKSNPDVYALGYIIGPRINAGGRIGASDLGVRLLISQSDEESRSLAQALEKLNDERKTLTSVMLDEAAIQANFQDNSPIVIVHGSNWHQGVIGIIAGRIKEQFDKPCLAIAFENGKGKGSARSVNGFDLGNFIARAKQLGILIDGGGHAMAAGFSILQERLEEFKEFINSEVKVTNSDGNTVTYDGVISTRGITPELANHLDYLAPYGNGNPSPKLIISNTKINYIRKVGQEHLRINLLPGDESKFSKKVTAVAFRAVGNEIGDFIQENHGKSVNFAGKLVWNTWNGNKSLEFHIDDASYIE